MATRKTASEVTLDTVDEAAYPGKTVRTLGPVALEVRRLWQEEGLTQAEIREKLQVSFDVIHQLMLQSYKSTMDTYLVFENQEKERLGL
jgi:hypothetical protein